MIYIMISAADAEQFSRGLCRLMRPASQRDERYITDLYCPFFVHPTNGWAVLELPETETVPIHTAADGSELLEVMQTFVTRGSLTEAEANGISQAVVGMRGREVRIADFVPPSWSKAVLTREQAEAAGYFPAEPE